MNTNMTGFTWFSKTFASMSFEQKIALALEGLNPILNISFAWSSAMSNCVQICNPYPAGGKFGHNTKLCKKKTLSITGQK